MWSQCDLMVMSSQNAPISDVDFATSIEASLAPRGLKILVHEKFQDQLRNKGFGVTVFEGKGRDSKRYQLEILTKRNRENEVMDLIEEYEPKAFIISYEPRRFKGGFLVKSMKRHMKKTNNKQQQSDSL